jgi:hypothetical protein
MILIIIIRRDFSMSGASVVIHKQNKYIEQFNEAGAVDEEHSIFVGGIT